MKNNIKNTLSIHSKELFIFIKITFTFIIAYVLSRYFDLNALVINLRMVPIWSIIGAMFLASLQLYIASWRIKLILQESYHIRPFTRLFQITLIGYFYSQTMISFIGGDGIKIWLLTKLGISTKEATHSVFIDRFSGLSTQLFAMILTFPFVIPLVKNTQQSMALFIISFTGLVITLMIAFYHKLHNLMKINLKIFDQLHDLSRTLIFLTYKKKLMCYIILMSFLIILINILILYILFLAEKVDIEFHYVFFLAPIVFFISMIPISFAGWGVREMVMASAFSLTNIPPEKSIAVSVEFGIILLLISLPGSLLLFFPTKTKT